MKIKLLVVALTLMLVVPAFAQEKVIGEELRIKKVLNLDEEGASIQLLTDKARAVNLLVSLWPDYGTANYYPGHLVKLSQANYLDFYTDFLVTKPTNVRFHYTWNGPEFLTATSDWYSTKRNTWYTFFFYTGNNWAKGMYDLTVSIEQASPASGAEGTNSCVYRLW